MAVLIPNIYKPEKCENCVCVRFGLYDIPFCRVLKKEAGKDLIQQCPMINLDPIEAAMIFGISEDRLESWIQETEIKLEVAHRISSNPMTTEEKE